VLAVERNALPGLPVQCAEFVPMMIGSDLFASNDARIQNIDHMRTFVGGNAAGLAPDLTPGFRGYMIDRARFDAALVEEARAAGAKCRFASPVRSVFPDGAVQLADGSVIRAKVIVGADGPHSPVGRAAGLPNRELVETRQITVDLMVPHGGTDIFLHPDIVGGYAWLFPKGKVCNLGIGVVASEKHRLKPLLEALHARLAGQGRVGKTVRAHTGGAIPVGGISGLHATLGATDVLLAGDAAGLTNPVTGAGINAAIISGRLAGEAAASVIAGDGGAAQDYAGEIDALLGRSLALALKRRRQLLDRYNEARAPTERQMRDGWIAYPQYWDDGDGHAVAQRNEETRMTA
jgi:flavin-dependent dehydrogenase